jgi:hypothetical protein
MTNASRTEPLPRQIRKRIELLMAHVAYVFRSGPRAAGILSRQD